MRRRCVLLAVSLLTSAFSPEARPVVARSEAPFVGRSETLPQQVETVPQQEPRAKAPEGELRRRAMFGAQLAPVTKEMRERWKLDGDSGVVLEKVYPGTAAADADFKAGDIIVAVAGAKLTGVPMFLERVAKARAGDVLTFDVVRDSARGETATRLSIGEKEPSPRVPAGQLQPRVLEQPRVLAIWGTSDWLVDRASNAWIAEVVNRAKPGNGTSSPWMQSTTSSSALPRRRRVTRSGNRPRGCRPGSSIRSSLKHCAGGWMRPQEGQRKCRETR